MLPQATDLKYFLAVAKSKNISRAAETLNISQPSLSLAIKRLENLCATELFLRNKNGVLLTQAGKAFEERAKNLLELWQSISYDIKKDQNELSGRYVIGAHISIALSSLTTAMSNLSKKYPSLEFHIEHGLSRLLTEQLINFAIDFAFAVNPVAHPDLVIKEIYRDEVTFLVSSKIFAKDVLLYDPNLIQGQSLLSATKNNGLKFSRAITSSSLEFLAKLAQQGAGVAILPKRINLNISGENLVPLSKSLPVFHDRHCLIYRADQQNSKASRLLARELFQASQLAK